MQRTLSPDTEPHAPLVSIAIPAYNCARTIRSTVSSCLQQTCTDIEVVVVDDGSTDDTAAELARLADPRLKIVRQRNGGLAAARNTAMQHCSGEFIAWMDADDIMCPDRIARQAALLIEQPEIVLVSSDFSAFIGDGPDTELSHIAGYYRVVPLAGGIANLYESSSPSPDAGIVRGRVYPRILLGNFVHPPTVMFRRAALQAAGKLDETFRNNCDYDFLIRIARLGEFAYIDRPLLRYRYQPTQMSSTQNLATVKLETARIIEKAMAKDTIYYSSHRSLMNERIADCLIGAARELVEKDPATALRLLWRSSQRKLLPTPLLGTLLRLAIPERLRASLRARRT